MKFLKLDKKKGVGGPSIKSRYAYLIYLDDIDYLPSTDDKGVRMEGDILLKEDCKMMPLYLTSSSQEFSYDILGDDDEKSYLVKFSGTHPGTELEALEFAKNMIEEPFLVLIPSCNESEPWKLLGEITNPLIFTSSHKAGKEGSKFTFNFEQRIGSEFIYFSYGGVEVPSGGEGVDPPSGAFDPTKWARIDASNIDPYITQWQDKLGINSSDHVLTLGPVTANENTVFLALHASGKNEVEISNTKYERTVAQQFTFTPVLTYIKVLILYAKPDSTVFYLSEGVESSEAKDPDYDGLFIARLTVNTQGAIIDEDDTFYKEKEEDGWRSVSIDVPVHILSYVSDLRSSFYIYENLVGGVIGGVRNGIINRLVSPFWEGKEFWIYNATGEDLELNSENVTEIDVFLFAETVVLKDKQSCKLKLRRDTLEIVGVSGGASFPEVGNDGDVLQKSGTNTVWGSIIKGVEFLGNAWLKLKIISFQGYTIAQKNAIASPTEGMLIYQNENPKGFQKYENGAWTALGNNISNADLSNVSARTFLQAADFTWNTAGFKYYLKNLVDKTGNVAYTKVVVVHPTTGETVTRDFADSQATTLAVQNANSTQKSAMRTALLGSAVPAIPVINNCFPSFIKIGEPTYIDLVGLNLTLLDPTFIYIELSGGAKIYATNFFNKTTTIVGATWLIPSGTPIGDYSIKIQNGVSSQGLSTGFIKVINDYVKVDLLTSNWRYISQDLTIDPVLFAENILAKNYLRSYLGNNSVFYPNQDSSAGLLWMTQNIIKKEKNYAITFTVSYNSTSGLGTATFPIFFGLSPTNSSTVETISSFIRTDGVTANFRVLDGAVVTINSPYKVEMIKTGNIVNYKLYTEFGVLIKQRLITLNDGYDYCIYVKETPQRSNVIHEFIFDIKEL